MTNTTIHSGTLLLISILFITTIIKAASSYATTINSSEALNKAVTKQPENANLYIQRGDAFFKQYDFFNAIENYNKAIELNEHADMAYFGRGLALARQGLIDEGIADLDVFIERNPKNSRAFTKRGVRYMWKQDYKQAQVDLLKAIELDPKNAEAHDDLGVIYAREKNYNKAIEHFFATITLQPSYQKAHHNLAMSLFLVGQDKAALAAVNKALELNPEHKDAMLLKSQIYKELGRIEEANELKEEAEFLPETNWSESVPVN